MDYLQNFIHRLEVGGGLRYFRASLVLMLLVALTAAYNFRAFRNMATQEAMDAAQLAHNIAQGKGYSTSFIRPLSIYLIRNHNQHSANPLPASQLADPGCLKGNHPDLANPPVYPFILAGLMKVLPFDYHVDTTHPFWSVPNPRISEQGGRMFYRYQPDFLIAVFNQVLFFVAVALLFFLARRLFDSGIAWLSAVLLVGTDLFWRFSVSGLSTMLLVVIYLGLVWCLVLLEHEVREPRGGAIRAILLAVAVGLLVALGGLTRYGFAWLILPVLLYVVLFTGSQRTVLGLVVFFAFAAAFAPWVVRNLTISGVPFGTANYALLENTGLFPEHRLQRSLEPDLSRSVLVFFWSKLVGNGRTVVTSELPRLGGSWISAFFLVALMIGFHSLSVRRLRYFVLTSLPVLCLVQALGRTQLSEDVPDINSENLLVIIAPLVLMYGVCLFYLLLERMSFAFRELRYIVIGLFLTLGCLPLVLVFLPPKTIPIVWPPYHPLAIQTVAGYMKEDELTMSDVPWAMAWYGHRQSVWLTLNAQNDFFAINDYLKPVKALYLTPATTDNRFYSQWLAAGELSWGSFILESLVRKEIPPTFPLRKSQPGWLPTGQLVLTDWERWSKPAK